jgi:hypothetical protein
MTYVCYEFTSVGTSDIVRIVATPEKESANNQYVPKNALYTGSSVDSYYEASETYTNVFYSIAFNPDLKLVITSYQFHVRNADTVFTSLNLAGSSQTGNKVCNMSMSSCS